MDLFALQVDESKLHPNFKQLLSTHDDVAREYLQSMTIGFTDRDNKFVKEFQTTFNSSFWELYLYSVFKKFGFNIDFSYEKPDFVITSPYKLCVEAVIANNAISDTPEYQKDFKKDCPELEEIVKTATIRLANAVISKYKKYKNIYSKDQSIVYFGESCQ